MELIDINSIVNHESGKTYREENLEKSHNIPLGTLVEVSGSGLRLYVVEHDRDFDGTPLYGLSFDKNWKKGMFMNDKMERARVDFGHVEDVLTIVKSKEDVEKDYL